METLSADLGTFLGGPSKTRVLSFASGFFSAAFMVLLVLAALTVGGSVAADEPLPPPNNDGCSVPDGYSCPQPAACGSTQGCCQCADIMQERIYCQCIFLEVGQSCDNEQPPQCD